MAGYLAQLRHAAIAYGDRLGDTRLLPLAIALALHLASLLVRSGVWCGILRAAFPEREVEMRPTVWAYLAGVGANALAPFRGGDIVPSAYPHWTLSTVPCRQIGLAKLA